MKKIISILTMFLLLLPQAKAETGLAETLLNRAVENGKVAEYLIPDATYNNLFVKATDDEVLVGYIKTQDNKDYLHVLAEKKGTNSLTGKLPNATENEVKNLADEVLVKGVGNADNLAMLINKWDNLTVAEAEELYSLLGKTDIQGTYKTVNQAEILAEINTIVETEKKVSGTSSFINPYSFSNPIDDIILTQDAIFIRAYSQYPVGRWMISIEDMKSFTSIDEYISKTALPIVEYGTGNLVRPTNLMIVKVPKGTVIRKSVARPQDWGGQGHLPGGAIQYEIRNFDYNTMKGWYKDMGNINEYLK